MDEAREFSLQHRVVRVVVADEASAETLINSDGERIPPTSAHDILNTIAGRIPLAMMNADALESVIRQPRYAYERVKRGIDIIIALVGLAIAVIPLVLIVMTLRLWRGAWPRVVKRTAVGLEEKTFTLSYLGLGETTSDLSKADLRARFLLRATGLEFVPNLIQVLSGRMSIVGPRPVTPEGFAAGKRMSQAFALRCLVRPGFIGLPQVRSSYSNAGRDARISLEYDLFYLVYRSLRLDGRILLRAIAIMLRSWGQFVLRVLRGLGRRTATVVLASSTKVGPARFASVALPVGEDGLTLATEPCIILGAGGGGRLLVRELKEHPDTGYWPVALLDDNVTLVGTRIEGVPVVGNIESLAAIAEREHVSTAVIAIPSAGDVLIQRISQIAQDAKLRTLSMPPIRSMLEGEQATRLKPVETRDLLGRPVVTTDAERARAFLSGKRVLVTGAAGSIGSEVVRQAVRGEPAVIIGLDNNESGLFDLQQELRVKHPGQEFIPVVASVVDQARINRLLDRLRPEVIFHAAAYKHVPLMEDFPYEAITTNIVGTSVMTKASRRFKVKRFVMVSTDKAVRPSSVMGASKRIAELIVRDAAVEGGLSACAVRFGNVLGSRGSVIPLFEKQIADGGPLTVTDARMTRYFMTIPEAAGLIIEAGAFGDRGVTYMLDMGDPVRIVDVAERLIRLHGKRPGVDIEIAFTGLRPGEKLFEELSLDFEAAALTAHPKIRILDEGRAKERMPASSILEHLVQVARSGMPNEIREAVMEAVTEADGIDSMLVPKTQPAPATAA